jgi:stage V sporulation protein AE
MVFLKAFLVGGAICAIVQVIIDKTKLTPGRIMVGLVCTGAILSAIGLYKPLADFAECGATVPLLGFGHNLWKGMKEAIDEFGLLGLFKGGFTSSAVGISGALIFGYLASRLFKSKMS